MPTHMMVGSRIRERRMLKGMRQMELAQLADISPSYLNLIEHNRRRIGGKTLLKLAELLEVETTFLSEGAEVELIAQLRDAVVGQENTQAELERAEEFAGRFPGWARLVVDLSQSRSNLEKVVETLNDRMTHDPQLSASLYGVLSAVTAIHSASSILVETKELEPEWRNRFHRNINEDSQRLTEGAETLVRYLEGGPDIEAEIRSPQYEMHAFLEANNYHFPQLESSGDNRLIESILQKAPLLTTQSAQGLARGVLTQYVTDARLLPLEVIGDVIKQHGVNPEVIIKYLNADLSAVFRRLACLPADITGPVGLIISDPSGALVFRKPYPGFAVPNGGGACALWPLFQILSQPYTTLKMKLHQTGRGGESVAAFTVAEVSMPRDFNAPAYIRPHMLLLPEQVADRNWAVRNVGRDCRICSLQDCNARRESSVFIDRS